MNEDGKKDGCIVIGGKKAKFIDPLSDWGFKKLFGTEANKEILLEFLRDLFPDKRIEDIAYLNNENQGLSESDRKSVFDVVCRTVAGDRFIVEVQKKDQWYFMERSLYYSTFPVQEQGLRGDWDFRLTPVYMVGILNFALKHDSNGLAKGSFGTAAAGNGGNPKLIHRYDLRERETGELMTDNLHFVFIEVGAFNRKEEELGSVMDKWMFVLKNMARLLDRPEALQERIFRKLFEAAQIAAMPHEEQVLYRDNMMTENDYRNCIDFAREEGHASGFAEGEARGLAAGEAKGRAEGIVEGEAKGIVTVAKSMKAKGYAIADIMDVSGLSQKEVEEL